MIAEWRHYRISIKLALNFGGITITGAGQNTLNVSAAKSVNGLASITGAVNVVDNFGTFNEGLALSGSTSNRLTNQPGAQVSGNFSATGPSNTIDNSGTFNNTLTLTGDGVNNIIDRASGTMQGIISNGSARDVVVNIGRINGSVLLGDGNDHLINRDLAQVLLRNVISNVVDMGAGNDQFDMLGGVVNGNVASRHRQ